MKIIITRDYDMMSTIAMQHLLSHMYKNKRVNLAITGSRTPRRMYEMLVDHVKLNPVFDNCHFYNFDELSFVDDVEEGITISDIKNQFLTPAKIKKENIHAFTEKNAEGYENKIHEDGGLDAILIGIGADGHFCGNMPGHTYFENFITNVPMTAQDKVNLQKAYNTTNAFCDNFVTFGPKMVMHAKQIILIANGKEKAEIIKTALQGPVTVDIPSSILQLHPNLVVILDEEAASLLS